MFRLQTQSDLFVRPNISRIQQTIFGYFRCYIKRVAADAFAFQIRQMLEQINFIDAQLDELEVQITTMLLEENQVITTILGIGNVLGAIIISEIGDISRFEIPHQNW